MMQIVYFSQKEQFLTQIESRPGDKIFITPSPAKADGLRERLSPTSFLDVITIAKFTSNLVENLWTEEERPQVKRKAELLLIFGILKGKYLPDLGYEQFTQAYNLFSDLRSFTLDEHALSSILEEQPEEIKNAVRLFWQLLGLTGYLDEHAAYQGIAEALRSNEEIDELKKTYIFWGFQHLNGQQVDLLKALSIRYEVIVPFPFSLREKLKRNDWVSWLKDSKTSELELDIIQNTPKASWLTVNSREMALHLKETVKENDQIVLGVSKLTPMHLDMIPSRSVSYKIPHQLIDAEIKEISRHLKQESKSGLSIKGLHEILKSKKNKSLKQLKANQLYLEALESIMEMTDEELKVDSFFLKLISEVVGLNQPRISYVPASAQELTVDLKDMSSLEHVDRKRRTILCIDERFEDIQGLGQNYAESIQKALGALGPLKRNELELLFKQWEFRDLLCRGEVLVLMGKETLKHNLIWKRLFSEIELTKMEMHKGHEQRKLVDHFTSLDKKAFEGNFSASKLQSFIDCPRKFYYSYVDKVFPEILLEKDFDPMTSGTIIHEIIEKFFKRKLADDQLNKLTTEVMQFYIKKRNLSLPKEIYLQHELIFNHRAWNGIKYVRSLEQAVGEKITWELEKDFELSVNFTMKGKIDSVGLSASYLFLLDFKSTNSHSGSEVEALESIQLWAYANAAKALISDFDTKKVILGFVLLDNPGKSRLFSDDKEFAKMIKEADFSGTTHVFKDSFSEILKSSQERMSSLALAINAEKKFLAKPRDSQKCTFCELNKLCIKSELINA
jgi:RecB family exonuclease